MIATIFILRNPQNSIGNYYVKAPILSLRDLDRKSIQTIGLPIEAGVAIAERVDVAAVLVT